MRLYWEVARRSFRRWSTYRSATAAGAFTNIVFGYIKAYILLAVYEHHAEVGGFDAADAVTYVFVTQGMFAMVGAFGWTEVADRVRTGDIVSDLYRPVDFEAYWLAQDVGRAGYQSLARGLPPVVAGAIGFDLVASSHPIDWFAFVVSLALAVVVSFGVRFLANLMAFWILDVRGPMQVVTIVWLFLSGALVPVTFFPSWLEQVARATPFAAIIQLPVEVLLGQHGGAGLAGTLGLQAAWAIALLLAGRLVTASATRKVVVQGG
jgi:ABC-2 type transport system permease protein